MDNDRKIDNKSKSRKTQAWLDEHGDKEHDIIRIEGVNRLVTRHLLKYTEQKNKIDIFTTGTLIWGYCRGWWPALIITPEDVQIDGNPDKLWVYWLTESKISQLKKQSQVMLFCDGAKQRLLTIIDKMKDSNIVFCEIMQILGDRLKCSFVKPYDAWIEKNFATLIDHKDYLIFYPYPCRVQENLENLRQIHSTKKTTKPIVKQKPSIGKYVEKSPDKLSSMDLHVKYQKIGTIVWAKISGQMWWPAMIIDFRDCAMNEPKLEYQWVMWYGDYTLSQVHYKFFIDFQNGIEKFEKNIMKSKRELYKRGVLEACKDYCSKYDSQTDKWNISEALNWFKQCSDMKNSHGDGQSTSKEPCYEREKYSSKIRQELIKNINKNSEAVIREQKLKDNELLSRLATDEGNPQELMCLMCLEINEIKMHEHPFFKGYLCEKCMIYHKSTIFAYDNDGKSFYCALCTLTETVVICDNPNCPRVYCTVCLKYLISPDTYCTILKTQPWCCFLCSDSSNLLGNSLIKPRKTWKDRIQQIFSINRLSISHYLTYYEEEKRKIRVLSLFDGISTGLLGLKNLEFEIESYFTSEIDPDAEIVSRVHFGTAITRLGDVRNITEEIVTEIAPIDLLIGGSPCNDLSLVNPKRRGLHDPNGTGILFFDYCRIKELVKQANKGRNLFWLYENVASMPEEYKQEISKNLGSEPDLIDSAEFSPQHRPRYYWTNIPLSSYTPFIKDLQDVLTPNCNRHALVQKIRTVTTQLKSLKQGSKALKPVIMDEEYDCLWTTELEEIFGFPRHYTDVKNLSATKRQKLIGQAWCVRTIMEILRPLQNFFLMKNSSCN